MNKSYYNITLDIKSVQSQITMLVKQGDTSRGVYISLTDGGKPYVIADKCFVVFKGNKSDGTEVGNNCYIKKNKICYDFTEQTVTSPGIVECEVSLYNSEGGLITTPRFTLIVDSRAVGGEEYKSSSEYTTLEEYLSEVRTEEEARQEIFANWQKVIRIVDSPKLWELGVGLYRVTTGFYEKEDSFINVSNSNPEESCLVHIMVNYDGFTFYMKSSYELVSETDNISEMGVCPSLEWGITNGTTLEKGVLQNKSFIVEESDDIETYSKSRNRYPSVRAMYNFVTNGLALKENLTNKVLSINDNNINSGQKYPSVKAVVDYVNSQSGGITGSSIDVQINGTSIVENGVANIPLALSTIPGVLCVGGSAFGITIFDSKTSRIAIAMSSNTDINSRTSLYKPIVPNNLDYAVKVAMCDGKGAEWTEEEKAAARARLGIDEILNTLQVGHTVTFTVDGEPYEIVSVKAGNSVNAPSIEPRKENLVFIRWNDGNGDEVAFPFTPTEDTEIVAYFSTRSNTNALYELFKIDKTLYPYVVLGGYQFNENETRCEVYFCSKFKDVNGRVVVPVGCKCYYTEILNVTANINNQNDIVTAILDLAPDIRSTTPSSDYKYMYTDNTLYYTNYKNNEFSFVPEYLT